MGTSVEQTAAGRLAARGLRCRHLTDPLGIEPGAPVFAWVPEAKGAAAQLAYRLLVATDPELLARGEADCWDSGRVASDRVNGVLYEGAPLRPRGRYWWTVQLWSDDGEPVDGEVAWFELGLGAEDWRASWIGGAAGVSSPLLRAELELPGPVRRARAYVSARGYCELRLNGAKVGDRVMDPPQTSYEHDPELLDGEGKPARIANPRTLYTTYDLSDELRQGANVIGLVLGHGWYSAEEDNGPGPLPRKPWGDRPSALVQIEVETAAGEVLLLSDGEWRTAPGPVLYNDYAQGERHDARLEPGGWDAPGFDAADWGEPAAVLAGPGAAPTTQMLEPVRVIETLAPVGESRAASGGRILDFGQHVSGWTRIAVSGPAGAEVTLRHTGELLADGELDDNANMGAWLPASQTDVYILAGGGSESWEPRFTLHGFRYVEVSAPDEVEVERVEARVVHSDLRSIGEFSCSNPLLERIHRNVRWTHRASFQGFPQDAAERNERVGWVGDPGWAIEDYLYNYDCVAFWLKWLDDLADAQLADGRFPVICPIMWRGGIDMAPPEDYEVPDDLDTMVYWPYGAWPDFSSTSYPSIAWQLFRYTGDATILAAHYEAMRRGLEYLCSIAEQRIVAVGLGDHQEPQPDGTSEVFAQRTPVELTSTAWFFEIARIVAAAAAALGREEDARSYGELAERIRVAFNDRFLDPEAASYASGSQTSLALPLWFGIVPDDHRERVLASLVRRIREVDDGHLETGTMGTAALQQVLGEGGAAEVMYGIATQTTYPSWGDQIERGATTVWETWGGDPDFSRNMKLMASVEKFLFRDIAGLTPAAPGWERIRVRPRLTHLLSHASARVETPRGVAAVAWRVEEGRLKLRIEVPSTSTAEVWLPGATPQDAGERRELGGGVHEFDVQSGGDDE